MQTHSLFEQSAEPIPAVQFSGSDYEESRDKKRLTTQLERVRLLMADGTWRTVERIASELRRAYPGVRFPEASISAQLRNLRKIDYLIETRNVCQGGLLYEYRLTGKVGVQVG
ncbi:hypothetical protein [Edaphobacter albus]|uniref:hypothetical protein n=1 Tax=Edaphobacter sp. 4G125 TaxID=2763071 RepID=UPI001646E0DA|nr:hypothetical protein [Edaphobacter sp. 4G125]QNI37490.1 hypothetical protein H7846_04090 [Edaphobacter sp. 4G125]